MERQDKEERGHTSSRNVPNVNVPDIKEPDVNVPNEVPNNVYSRDLGESISDKEERGHTSSAESGHTSSGNVHNVNVPNINFPNVSVSEVNVPDIDDPGRDQNDNTVADNKLQESPDGNRKKEGILELVYGVLFEPVLTFAGFPRQPPVMAAVVVVVLLKLAESLMELFTMPPQYIQGLQMLGLPELDALRSMLPLVAVGGFFLSMAKWFFMAGLLHLLADLYGGKGDARGVFAVCGLAGLPAAFMIPVQLGAAVFQSSSAADIITALLNLAVFIWSVVLLVIGIREVHGFGTGKAVLTVFTPVISLALLLIVGLIMVGFFISTLPGWNMF